MCDSKSEMSFLSHRDSFFTLSCTFAACGDFPTLFWILSHQSLGWNLWHFKFLITPELRVLNTLLVMYRLSYSSVSCVRLFETPWTAACQASLSITASRSLLRLVSIDAIQPSHPLSALLLPPSILPSIRVFSNESVLHIRWPKYWGFSFNIGPSNEHPGLISFRMDWLDLLAVQGTLKSLLQHHSSKSSILLCSAFFILQLSHPYMSTGKTIALIRWTFCWKIMSLLFNMLSRLIIAFLPKSKCLLISWLQSPSAVILEPKK